MDLQNKITSANIKYLIAIYRLNKNNGGVKCIDIAKNLSVSKPSVHSMIRLMEKMNLVHKQRYGKVFLTEEGSILAVVFDKQFSIINDYFKNNLGFDNSISELSAYALVSEIPQNSVEVVCSTMNVYASLNT